ncbi:MAG: thermonuclease family protein [Gammaproteobacteria bacterium]|nr:thermonuclease family protein [Gammaproteobacteria bacterium]MBU1723947.1 thermonuclease family protein [Gammaproteobacteria bacterium]MBU2007140.1 thermonuclease family protein [Gammaproteobacteria bacterium]
MNKTSHLATLALSCAMLLTPYAAAETVAAPQPVAFVVEAIEDGDTFSVNTQEGVKRIQLAAIDAPEDTENAKLQLDMKKSGLDKQTLTGMGKAATGHLQTLLPVGGEILLLADMTVTDKYGRISAEAFDQNGQSINAAMIADGYAIVLTKQPMDDARKEALLQHQQAAQEAQKGLWGSHPETVAIWSKL